MILVECNADFALVKSLGVVPAAIMHLAGKGRICKKLKDSVAMKGLVDEDPGSFQPRYMDELAEEFCRHDLRLLKDKERNNKLIVLCPRLEEWILETAKRAGVNVKDFGLEPRPDYLHEVLGDLPEKVAMLADSLKIKKSERLDLLESLVKP